MVNIASTRMHSSGMRTARMLTVSRSALGGGSARPLDAHRLDADQPHPPPPRGQNDNKRL